jgi:hypothetical protein
MVVVRNGARFAFDSHNKVRDTITARDEKDKWLFLFKNR